MESGRVDSREVCDCFAADGYGALKLVTQSPAEVHSL